MSNIKILRRKQVMDNNKKETEGFKYTYSAKEQEEIKNIRTKYTKREEDKMERLRRLDNSVTQKAQVVSLVFGILGVLILGAGMSFCMTDLSGLFPSEGMAMVFGIIIGVIGGIIAALAYPMYNLVTKRERKKLAPEILRLTDELIR